MDWRTKIVPEIIARVLILFPIIFLIFLAIQDWWLLFVAVSGAIGVGCVAIGMGMLKGLDHLRKVEEMEAKLREEIGEQEIENALRKLKDRLK